MLEGLKETLQYINSLKADSMEPKVVEIKGRTYCNKDMTRYYGEEDAMAKELSVNTLTALVDYIKGKPEELRDTMVLHIVNPTCVALYSGLIHIQLCRCQVTSNQEPQQIIRMTVPRRRQPLSRVWSSRMLLCLIR